MKKKLTLEQIDQIYIKSLKGYHNREIAKEYKVSEQTIARALNSIIKDHNYQLSLATISIFLEQFNRYGDFLTNQVRELEEMMGDKSELSGEARYDKLELMDAQF